MFLLCVRCSWCFLGFLLLCLLCVLCFWVLNLFSIVLGLALWSYGCPLAICSCVLCPRVLCFCFCSSLFDIVLVFVICHLFVVRHRFHRSLLLFMVLVLVLSSSLSIFIVVFCFYIVLCCWLAFDLYYCSCAFVLCVCLLLYILVLCSSIWFCYFLLSFVHEFVCCSCHSLLVVIGYLMLINVIMNIYSWLLMLFLVVVLRCWLDVFLCVVLWFLNLCFPCSWSCSFSKFLVIVLVVSYSCC